MCKCGPNGLTFIWLLLQGLFGQIIQLIKLKNTESDVYFLCAALDVYFYEAKCQYY